MRCAHRQVFSTAATRQMPQPSMPSQGHAFQGHCMPSQGHVSARAGRVTWQKRRQPLQPLRRGVAVVQCDTHTTCPALDGQAEATAVLVVGLEHQYATGRIRSNRASATSTPQAQSMARCASTVRSTGAGLLPGRRRTSTTNSAAWMGDSTRFSVTPAHCQDLRISNRWARTRPAPICVAPCEAASQPYNLVCASDQPASARPHKLCIPHAWLRKKESRAAHS